MSEAEKTPFKRGIILHYLSKFRIQRQVWLKLQNAYRGHNSISFCLVQPKVSKSGKLLSPNH